jgi:hypothetical protein
MAVPARERDEDPGTFIGTNIVSREQVDADK